MKKIPHVPKCSYHQNDEISRGELIWRAIKLPIFSVALVPLTVGSSAAYLETGMFFSKRYFALLVSSILIITWLNLSNDVYDFDAGADKDKKESVVNILGSRSVTHLAANTSFFIGLIGLIWASAQSGDIRTILLLTFAISFGYVYQCPPFRLGYIGLGEPLCFAAFGPFATTAFYFSQGGKILSQGSEVFQLPITGRVLSASLFVGITTSLILFCSHFHQIEDDQAVGKISPLVRMGTETGSKVVQVSVTVLYSLLSVLVLTRILPPITAFLCALTFPIGKLVLKFVEENHNNKIKIFMAKYYCVRLHAAFGAALATSFVLARTRILI